MRVASVPAAHPYVRHCLDPDGAGGVVLLEDAVVPGRPPGRWWPPAMVDPGWVAANADRFDVLHLHFGLESFGPEHLAATVAALRQAARPLVFTVHDLVNPQLADQAAHLAGLDVVVPAADGLVTLTHGAAARVAARWGRTPIVLPHPHLLALDLPVPGPPRAAAPVVGVHLRDLRPNIDGPGTVARLRAAVEGTGAVGRVLLNDRVRDPVARDAVRDACGDALELVERPRPDDRGLADELAALDVAVLPYRHGTHSGWVELCWDLGVPVATPEVGCLAEQHPDASATFGDVRAAVARLLAGGTRAGTPERAALVRDRRAARIVERRVLADALHELYARVVASAQQR